MTPEELEKLEIVADGFGMVDLVIDGRQVRVPVARHAGALFQAESDGMFYDRDGIPWLTGWIDGKHVRRTYPYWDATPTEGIRRQS